MTQSAIVDFDEVSASALDSVLAKFKENYPTPRNNWASPDPHFDLRVSYKLSDPATPVFNLKSFPSPEEYFLSKCTFILWFPEALYSCLRVGDGYVCCKNRKCKAPAKDINHDGWMAKPRRCLSRHEVFFVLGRNYRCTKCGLQFNNLALEVTQLLPESISHHLPIVFSHRGGIERYTSRVPRILFDSGGGAVSCKDNDTHLGHFK